MSEFKLAIQPLLEIEGGESDKDDPGGLTKFGITLTFLKAANIHINDDGIIDEKDIADLTIEDAISIYRVHWWEKFGYSHINDQAIANKVFEMAVNMGGGQAHKLAQRACWAFGGIGTTDDDGILGEKTLKELNRWGADLLPVLKSEQANFYRLLAQKDIRIKNRLKGLLNRAYR